MLFLIFRQFEIITIRSFHFFKLVKIKKIATNLFDHAVMDTVFAVMWVTTKKHGSDRYTFIGYKQTYKNKQNSRDVSVFLLEFLVSCRHNLVFRWQNHLSRHWKIKTNTDKQKRSKSKSTFNSIVSCVHSSVILYR